MKLLYYIMKGMTHNTLCPLVVIFPVISYILTAINTSSLTILFFHLLNIINDKKKTFSCYQEMQSPNPSVLKTSL